jgi:hypothetical protein
MKPFSILFLLLIALPISVFAQPEGGGGALLHAAFICNDGTVWCSGNNNRGQLGDGGVSDQISPVQAIGLTGIVQVSTSYEHTVAAKNDGTVWTWGANDIGQLGNGSSADSNVPLQVIGLNNVVQVAAGRKFCLALKSNGTVWAWGANNHGQMGNPYYWAGNATPVPISGLSNIVDIAVGYNHSLAVDGNGDVWVWGKNHLAQLGLGHQDTLPFPIKIPGMANARKVSCGKNHSFVLKSDSTVWSWGGDNGGGELGLGPVGFVNTPQKIQTLSEITWIDGGLFHSFAIDKNGVTYGWGDNSNGQIGAANNLISNFDIPEVCMEHSENSPIFAELLFTIQYKTDGTIWSWGVNDHGQLGAGLLVNSISPVQVQVPCVGMVDISEQENVNEFLITPGMEQGIYQVSLSLYTPERIQYSIYNIDGQLIQTNKGMEINNTHQFSIDLRSTSKGIYLLQIQAGDEVITKKLVH